MDSEGKAVLAVVSVTLLGLALGAPLIWGFVFSGLGVLTWIIGSFGWLPSGWFANNLVTLSWTAGAVTLPTIAYALYRLIPRVYAIEHALVTRSKAMPEPAAVALVAPPALPPMTMQVQPPPAMLPTPPPVAAAPKAAAQPPTSKGKSKKKRAG